MPRYVGLIRGINVGGKKLVKMADLRARLTESGLDNVRTFLQSGNIVFDAAERSAADLEALVERTLSAMGVDANAIVRSASDFVALAAQNPFGQAADEDPGHVLLMLGRDCPTTADIADMQARYPGTEQILRVGEAVYLHCPDGIGTSRLLGASAWVKLTATMTARNWNTVRILMAAVAE